MPPDKRKDCFSPQNTFKNPDTLSIAEKLLSHKKVLVFHGGGGKARVLPAVLDVLYRYGLKRKPETVVGISAGCFMALAIALGITEKEDLLYHFKQVPFETFKIKSFKRTIIFFMRLLAVFFPSLFSAHFQRVYNWAYYESSGIREYVRKKIISRVPAWQALEDEAEHYGYHYTKRKDPTFAELYEKMGVNLELHVSVAEEACTKVYSYFTTPNEKVSLALQASTSIPGVYPSVKMISGKTAIDGGMTDCIADFDAIPPEERLHIRLLDENAGEFYHHRSKYIALPSLETHLKRLLGLFNNFEYKHFPDSEKAVSIAVEVPVDTLHYQWSDKEQAAYDDHACEQTIGQLKQMVELKKDYQQQKKLLADARLIYLCSTEVEAAELMHSLCYNNGYVSSGKTQQVGEGQWAVICEPEKSLCRNVMRMG